MSNWSARPLDARWMALRKQLQERYAALARLPDASRLAYLRGPLHTVTEEQIAAQWQLAVKSPVSEMPTANNIYIHVPFCKSICSFCNYERLRPSNPAILQVYLDRIEQSMAVLGPAVESIQWGAVYVGGGTPSTLPAAMLDRLFTSLERHFDIDSNAARSFEFDPQVMNTSRVEVLKRHGFSHFSFGIQTLSAGVNQAHNRGPQSRETVAKRFEELYSAGLHDVACDFLLGLAGTTPDEILSDIEWVLETYSPRWIDVFQISPTPEYVQTHFDGDLDRFWSHLAPFQEMVPDAMAEIGKRQRYKVNTGGGHRYTLHRTYVPAGWPPVPRPPYGYNQLVSEAQRPLHLLGLGPSARSQIFGYAAFQCRDPGENSTSEGPAFYRGHRIGLADEIRNYLVHQLRDGDTVGRDQFRSIFGVDVVDAVPVALSAWDQEGLVTVSRRQVSLAPQSRAERTHSLLWLVPEEDLEHEIARRQQLDLTPDGVDRLAEDLGVGTPLSSQHSFGGVDEGRVIIHTPQRLRMRFRVAPGLEAGAPLRLVLESKPPATAEARTDLTRAMAQVRGVLRAAELRHQG